MRYRPQVTAWGVFLTETPLDRDSPCTETPWQKPPLWTESQTGVKTLPCRNFVAGGNNAKIYSALISSSNKNFRFQLEYFLPGVPYTCSELATISFELKYEVQMELELYLM